MSDSPGSREAHSYSWEKLESDQPMPLVHRRRIHGDRMTVARVRLEKGFKIDPHSHPEEQIVLILSGSIRFLLGESPHQEEVVLGAEEILQVPGGVPHGAEALEETVVLDLFSPPARATGVDRG